MNSKQFTSQSAFSLIELLTVLTTISILSMLLLPALTKAKLKGVGISCMNNNRQLCMAWKMYTDENDEELLFASADRSNPKTFSATWVNGVMDFDPANASNWDPEVDIKESPLWNYAKSTSIWKCPADTSQVRVKGQVHARVRSMAMSIWFGGFGGRVPEVALGRGFRIYRKLSDIFDPGPSRTWLLLDMREDSVNWGNFFTVMHGWPDRPRDFRFHQDFPASYHHRAAGISFVDGHAEIHRWRDDRTMPPIVKGKWRLPPDVPVPSRNNPDIAWLQHHATRKINP